MTDTDKPLTDQEEADSFRKRFNSMAMPIVGLMQEAVRKGFALGFNIALTPDGKPSLTCDVSKVTKL